MTEPGPLVLDTHVWIWLSFGDKALGDDARRFIDRAGRDGTLLVAAISVWEVAMLVSKGRLDLFMPPLEWATAALSGPGISLAPLTPDIAVEACHLPGAFHRDPVDRMIVATARVLGARLATRDQRILAYAAAGNVAVVPA
jgi:PIN domain nuclease of toxin-antitoxin system